MNILPNNLGFGFTGRISGMDYHPASGLLYAIVKTSTDRGALMYLTTVDPITGRVTSIIGGPHDIPFESVAFAQAQEPIPTLGQWGLIILALSFLITGVVYQRQGSTITEHST